MDVVLDLEGKEEDLQVERNEEEDELAEEKEGEDSDEIEQNGLLMSRLLF